MVELFPTTFDLNAAVLDAKVILEHQDQWTRANEQRFGAAFKAKHKFLKRRFTRLERRAKPRDYRTDVSEGVITAMNRAIQSMEKYTSRKDVADLGTSLGALVGVMRFGATSGYFYMQEFMSEYSGFAHQVISRVETMMEHLHGIDKSFHLPHLAERCDHIRGVYRKELPFNEYNALVTEVISLITAYNS